MSTVDPETREPIPPGPVSMVQGMRQRRALAWVYKLILVLALVGSALPADYSGPTAAVVIGLVVATPLVRICWLIFRWNQEDDRPFVIAGLALLLVVATGTVVSIFLR